MYDFKIAQNSDCPRIASLVNSAYRGESSKKGWTTEADLLGGQRTDPESLQEMMSEPGAQVQLMLMQDQLVGCVFLKLLNAQEAYLGMLTVDPEIQGQGLGGKMLKHSEAVVLSWGCDVLKMDVIPLRTELVDFYHRKGYKETGIEKPFPENSEKFGLPKVQNLKLVELQKKLK